MSRFASLRSLPHERRRQAARVSTRMTASPDEPGRISRASPARPRAGHFTAAAAAIAGLRRWVRAPRPCRPSKLRFEVDAQRLPAPTRSGFMPRHIEQPDSRHWNPASTNTRSSPSASAWRLMRVEPGETIASTCDATVRPSHHRGGGAQILDAAVGARADEDVVDRDVGHPGAGDEAHVLERPRHRAAFRLRSARRPGPAPRR